MKLKDELNKFGKVINGMIFKQLKNIRKLKIF